MDKKQAIDFEGIDGEDIADWIEDKTELLEIAKGQIEVNEARLAKADIDEVKLQQSLATMTNLTDKLETEQELEDLVDWRAETIEHTEKLHEAVATLTEVLARMRT